MRDIFDKKDSKLRNGTNTLLTGCFLQARSEWNTDKNSSLICGGAPKTGQNMKCQNARTGNTRLALHASFC